MQKRKNDVILAAKELFKTKGFTTSSVQDIIDTCHISKGTFYNYFTSKNEFVMAYLEAVRKEEYQRRNALVEGKNIMDKDIFAKQILVRMEITSEYSLRPIFEYAFHSKNQDLKKFMENSLIEELSWIGKRIIDIYGKESILYASDCAVFIHAMIQNMLYIWKAFTKEAINTTLLVQYIIRRLDDMIASLIGTEDYFLHEVLLHHQSEINEETIMRTTMIRELATLKQGLNPDEHAFKEHISFLLEELTSSEPRIYVLHSCLNACMDLTTQAEQQDCLRKAQQQIDRIIKKDCSS